MHNLEGNKMYFQNFGLHFADNYVEQIKYAFDKIWFQTYILYVHFLKTYYSDSGTSKTSKFIKIFDPKIFIVTKLSL